MAFGSFFKNIICGAKNIIGKVAPVVKKGLVAVSKIAPAIAAGAAFRVPTGATLGSVSNTVGSIAGGVSQFLDNWWINSGSQSPPKTLGTSRAGRFAVAMLK